MLSFDPQVESKIEKTGENGPRKHFTGQCLLISSSTFILRLFLYVLDIDRRCIHFSGFSLFLFSFSFLQPQTTVIIFSSSFFPPWLPRCFITLDHLTALLPLVFESLCSSYPSLCNKAPPNLSARHNCTHCLFFNPLGFWSLPGFAWWFHLIYQAATNRSVAGWVGGRCHLSAYLPTLISWEEGGNVSGLELWKLEKLFLTVSSPFFVILVHQLDDSHASYLVAQGFKGAFLSRGWEQPVCSELTS